MLCVLHLLQQLLYPSRRPEICAECSTKWKKIEKLSVSPTFCCCRSLIPQFYYRTTPKFYHLLGFGAQSKKSSAPPHGFQRHPLSSLSYQQTQYPTTPISFVISCLTWNGSFLITAVQLWIMGPSFEMCNYSPKSIVKTQISLT